MLEALKDGFVKVVILLCILLGLPDDGKTHLKLMLLNEQHCIFELVPTVLKLPYASKLGPSPEHDYKQLTANGRKLEIQTCLT